MDSHQILLPTTAAGFNALSSYAIRKKSAQDIPLPVVQERQEHSLDVGFFSLTSHEFRTPLSAILCSTYLIESYNGEDQVEKRQKHIERIRSSVENLVSILDNFIALEKLEHGKIPLKPAYFDLPAFSADIIEEVNGMRKEGQQILYQHKGAIEVATDKIILKNVLLNLLSNALKYSDAQTVIHFSSERKGDQITIAIRDEGIGIPEEDQAYLFGKFYRARNVGSRQGTGLGLNIVKKYVELLDGAIHFDSALGIGTTFSLTLPMQVYLGNDVFVG